MLTLVSIVMITENKSLHLIHNEDAEIEFINKYER